MTVQLPGPIKAYFDATNAGNADAVAAVFTSDGEVRDEGGTHRGRVAIAVWAGDTIGRYRMQADPLTAAGAGGRHRVTARVSGTFPGSPLVFTYQFDLASDAVQALEISL